MDTAVSLVQAYLRVNGYFTVAEYPVLEATRGGGYKMATDLDLLAFRFPHVGGPVVRTERGSEQPVPFAPDPQLGVPEDDADMMVGEVKEGRAKLNPAVRDPDVLAVALARFGCCPGDRAVEAAEELLRRGSAHLPVGHRIRLVAFGGTGGGGGGPVDTTVSLGRVTEYLRSYLRKHWEVLRHAQFKDPTLGLLATLEKAER